MVRSKVKKGRPRVESWRMQILEVQALQWGENWPERQEEDQRDPKKGQRVAKAGMIICAKCCREKRGVAVQGRSCMGT